MTIDNDIGSVALSGSISVNPTQTTTYVLTAKGKGGSVTANATVTFRPPQPPAVSFTANPVTIQSGGHSTLSWSVSNVDSIFIDHGIGAVAASGSMVVSPLENTIYTLTASNIEGITNASSGIYLGSGRPCYAYVPKSYYDVFNNFKSLIMVVDTASNSIVKKIDTAIETKGVLVGSGGTCIYISSTYANKISKIDPISLQVSGSLGGVEGQPREMALHVFGNQVYTIGSNSPTLTVIDDTGPAMILRKILTLPAIATDLVVHLDGSKLYVSISSLNQILVLDTAVLNEPLDGIINKPLDEELIDTIAITNPRHMQFDPEGSRLFVCQSQDLIVMDVSSQGIIHIYPNVQPYVVHRNPGGDRMYLLNAYHYYIIDLQTLEISTGYANSNWNFNENISIHPDGSRIYSVEASSFHIFDAGANTDLGYIDLENRYSAQMFYGTWVSYVPNMISGQISQNDAPLSGALIQLEGNGIIRETLSDTQGNYHFAVKDGSYHIEASYQNLFVNPEFIEVNVNGGNVTDQNFVFSGEASTPSVEFFVNPTSIQAGENATLSWDSTDATSAAIDNGIGDVPVDGNMTVSPAQTTTYTITVTGPGGTATATTTLAVNSVPPPGIVFSASPLTIERGQSSTLSWTTVDATSASIDNDIGDVPVNGSQVVTPLQTTTYTITAIGPGGSNTAQATVTVTEPLPQVQFSADPAILPPGQSATLTWTTANVTSASIDNDIGSVAINGSVSVTPTQDTTYTITVTGPGGTAMASVTVKMLIGHLQSIWDGMKNALLGQDIDQAIDNFISDTQNDYRDIFNALYSNLPQIVSEMQEIEPVYFEENGAQYRIKRHEVIQGSEYDMTYYIYFQKDENGIWKIIRF